MTRTENGGWSNNDRKLFNHQPSRPTNESFRSVHLIRLGNIHTIQVRVLRQDDQNPMSQRKHYAVVLGLDKFYVDYPTIQTALDEICEQYIFQEECSPSGFKHYQCYLCLKEKKAGTWLVNKLKVHLAGDSTAVQWQPTKSATALAFYTSKQETRVKGPWAKGIEIPANQLAKKVDDKLRGKTLYPWQEDVMRIINREDADDRTVHWYWETTGKVGKSSFIRHLLLTRKDVICVDSGKRSDIYFAITEVKVKPKVVFVDLARAAVPCTDFYIALERIKDGFFFSSKYESGQMVLDEIPHLIVTSNYPPNAAMWSGDRLDVHEIHNGHFVPGYMAEIINSL